MAILANPDPSTPDDRQGALISVKDADSAESYGFSS